jgi:hypothetical protein
MAVNIQGCLFLKEPFFHVTISYPFMLFSEILFQLVIFGINITDW